MEYFFIPVAPQKWGLFTISRVSVCLCFWGSFCRSICTIMYVWVYVCMWVSWPLGSSCSKCFSFCFDSRVALPLRSTTNKNNTNHNTWGGNLLKAASLNNQQQYQNIRKRTVLREKSLWWKETLSYWEGKTMGNCADYFWAIFYVSKFKFPFLVYIFLKLKRQLGQFFITFHGDINLFYSERIFATSL